MNFEQYIKLVNDLCYLYDLDVNKIDSLKFNFVSPDLLLEYIYKSNGDYNSINSQIINKNKDLSFLINPDGGKSYDIKEQSVFRNNNIFYLCLNDKNKYIDLIKKWDAPEYLQSLNLYK